MVLSLQPKVVFVAYLYPGFTELCPLRQLLSGVDVRVLGPLEGLLQLVQLVGREGGPRPPLFPLQLDPRLGLEVAVNAVAVNPAAPVHHAHLVFN